MLIGNQSGFPAGRGREEWVREGIEGGDVKKDKINHLGGVVRTEEGQSPLEQPGGHH